MNEKNSRLEEKFKTAVDYHKKNDFEKTEKILIEILKETIFFRYLITDMKKAAIKGYI